MYQIFNAIRNAFLAILRIPTRFFSLPKRLLSMSFPMRVAVILSIFLTLLTITAFVGFVLNSQQSTDRSEWFENWQQILLVLALLVAIPVVVYHALRLWLEPDVSRFPEVDRAWEAGIGALRQNGLDLNQIPVFLVLGAHSDAQTRALLSASGYEFLVEGIPEGRVPLQWYANDQAILLVSQGLGCLSRFNATASPHSPQAVAADAPRGDIRSTLVAGQEASAAVETGEAADAAASDFGGGDIRGTLVAGGSVRQTVVAGAEWSPRPAAGGKVLSHREVEDETERLAYVCQFLQRSRQPLCAINGILTLLPAPLIDGALYMVAARDLPEMVRRDLNTIRETTKLLCPVTALVTGMESEPGFSELIRRIGMQKAKEARFGKGYKVWNPASTQNLDALAAHVCGAFEDWVYTLFRDKGGLTKTGNGKLYSLLCKIRSRWHSRLRGILLNGYGQQEGEPSPLFGGCYFAATGSSQDRQAFVRSTLDKMLQQEEELEWTPAAVEEDRRFHALANLGLWFNGALVLALVSLVVYRFGGFEPLW